MDKITPPFPIKTTDPKFANNFSEVSNTPPVTEKPTVTAVPAVLLVSDRRRATSQDSQRASTSNNKITRKKVIKVLLDTGSDGDLWFHKKGTPKHFSYLTRQVSKSWHTSNGIFQTKEIQTQIL